MSMFYVVYLQGLCRRRNWADPIYDIKRCRDGYNCTVWVNNREFYGGDGHESEQIAQSAASMRAFMILRNFSINDGMYPGRVRAGGVVQELPVLINTRRSYGKGSSRHSYMAVSCAASDATSTCSYYTAQSRQSKKSSRNLNIVNTAWQEFLRRKNLLPDWSYEINWSGRGQHVEFTEDEQPAVDAILTSMGFLGHSATAIVDKVRCKRIMLARKKIRCTWRLKREEAIEEVAHLQRLHHSHIVRGVGTYTIGKALCILLYPATEYNLETFLDQCVDLESSATSGDGLITLHTMLHDVRRFFECLTNTISFVHEHLIKHMDIKPTNILIQEKRWKHSTKQYKIYLADFGTARSYKTTIEAETDSLTSFTKAFAAPEVIRQEKRSFSADIFSLGCVFLEIIAVLSTPMQRQSLEQTRKQNLEGDCSYQANIKAILEGEIFSEHTFIDPRCKMWLDTASQMVRADPASRPSANQLKDIFGTGQDCCFMGPELFEAVDQASN